MVVDAHDAEVGVLDLTGGVLTRKFGGDLLMLAVVPGGFLERQFMFYHTTNDCTGDRYLPNNGGVFAYFGWFLGGTVFYTALADPASPLFNQPLNSYEVMNPGDNPMIPGACTPYPAGYQGLQSVGKAITVTDPALGALVTPFRLK